MALLLLAAAAVLTLVLPVQVARRSGSPWAAALAWVLPLGMVLWSFVLSRTEDPAACEDACGSLWVFVGATLALVPAVLGTVGALLAVRGGRRRRAG